MRWAALLLVMLLGFVPTVRGQTVDDLRVSIVVFGAGPAIWERFGHIALRFRSSSTGVDVSYDWGRFDFNQPGFIKRFMLGDPLYAMGAARTSPMLEFYRVELGRTVRELELRLTPDEARRLLDWTIAQDNDRDRFYRYDYFRDNCATRVRDGIDHATAGRLREYLGSIEVSDTLRSEMRRLVPVGIANVALLPGMDLLGGSPIDEPMSAWERAFVPMRFIEDLAATPLARGPIVELARTRRIENLEPADQPALALWTLASGVVIAGLVFWLLSVGRIGRVAVAVWSVFCVFAGALILLAWTMTDHWAIAWNANILLFSPLSLVLLASLLVGVGRVKVATAIVLLGLLSIIFAMRWGQDHLAAFALAMPVHMAAALGLWTTTRPASRVSAESSADQSNEVDAHESSTKPAEFF